MREVERFEYHGARVAVYQDQWGYGIDVEDGGCFVDDERYRTSGAAANTARVMVDRRWRERRRGL